MFNCCESICQVVDDALMCANEAQMKPSESNFVEEKFKKAIDALSDYEKKFHSEKTIAKRIAEAELNKELKEKYRVRDGLHATLLRHILIPVPCCL